MPGAMSGGPAIVATALRPLSSRYRTAALAPPMLSASTYDSALPQATGRPQCTSGMPRLA